VIKSAMALLIWGGQVVVSTHDGVANPFNLLIENQGREAQGTQAAQDHVPGRDGGRAL
jgi:phage FluMu gp28-like protein